MEIIMALSLFIGIVILIVLVFIGYHLYINNKRSDAVNELLSSKESDLIDLYSMLEQMMTEIDDYTQKVKLEIQQDKEQIKNWRDEVFAKINTENHAVTVTTAPIQEAENNNQEDDQFTVKKHQKLRDLKEIKIRSMYNKGTSVPNIAKEMNIGQGEVQLILNLKNKII